MFGRAKLKAEIMRLTYRVADLEERLCPCEEHDWKQIKSEFVIGTMPTDISTIYTCKCRRCGKTKKTYEP